MSAPRDADLSAADSEELIEAQWSALRAMYQAHHDGSETCLCKHLVAAPRETAALDVERLEVARMAVVMFLIGGDRGYDEAVRDAISARKWLADDPPVPADLAEEIWTAVDEHYARLSASGPEAER